MQGNNTPTLLNGQGSSASGVPRISGAAIPGAPNAHVHVPFWGELSGSSWNAQVVFCRRMGKYKSNLTLMHDLLQKRDFLVV